MHTFNAVITLNYLYSNVNLAAVYLLMQCTGMKAMCSCRQFRNSKMLVKCCPAAGTCLYKQVNTQCNNKCLQKNFLQASVEPVFNCIMCALLNCKNFLHVYTLSKIAAICKHWKFVVACCRLKEKLIAQLQGNCWHAVTSIWCDTVFSYCRFKEKVHCNTVGTNQMTKCMLFLRLVLSFKCSQIRCNGQIYPSCRYFLRDVPKLVPFLMHMTKMSFYDTLKNTVHSQQNIL